MVVELRESHAQAWFLGNRIDVRELERGDVVDVAPLTVRAGQGGYAVLFRYGAAVAIDLSPEEEAAFMRSIGPQVAGRFDAPETEALTIAKGEDGNDARIDAEGVLRLDAINLARLQIVAHVLAKSAVLAYYEERVATAFDQIERLAQQLQRGKGEGPSRSELLRHIGSALTAQVQTVGRVEVTEKPESTWDNPDLDRLYERLSLEYELRDRDLALTRKLDFISQIAETYLDLLQTRQSLRIEWYVVFLIIVEIALSVYQMFL